MKILLKDINTDYLLVCATNEYLVEYSDLSENARYTLTGFSGSTGDALVTQDNIYLFVDGRYHIQADMEAKENVTVVKLDIGQNQDEEIVKLIKPASIFSVVAKKISQKRLEHFKELLNGKNVKIELLPKDPINNRTLQHTKQIKKVSYTPQNIVFEEPAFITNLEEVSYLTGRRDFSTDYSSKIWGKLFVKKDEKPILFMKNDLAEDFLKNYDEELIVDKASINAYDYSLIKYPVSQTSPVKDLKAIKTDEEIESYKKDFQSTDKTLMAIREFIEKNDNLSEYDISAQLKKEFLNYGAKNLSFKPIVAINKHSALAHYSQASRDTRLQNGDLVLIDCGAYYENGLATDITRVFVKGEPDNLQKEVYTTVLKVFLNCYNSTLATGHEIDNLAHTLLDYQIENFQFTHGLGHGIGINVHEAPPMLNTSEGAKREILDNMTFTIEPGLYNKDFFGVRLENSCYKKNGKIHSFTKMCYEKKLINYNLLSPQEQLWLKDFDVL